MAMKSLESSTIKEFKRLLLTGGDLRDLFARNVGPCQTAGGIWRFFGSDIPIPGVAEWNSEDLWKRYWNEPIKRSFSFGEDIFGNQLITFAERKRAYLMDHESGEFHDLYLDVLELMETVLESGIDWIDFYNNGTLCVARQRLADVPDNCHLHWIKPLLLGGRVADENTSVVERSSHMVGHGKLWLTIQGLEMGGNVVIRAKNVDKPF